MLSLDTVTRAEFEAHLAETFHLVLRDGRFPLELSAVRPLGAGAPGARRDPFALDFRSPKPIRLPQGTYRLENEKLGAMDIFLVQHGPEEIEAVLN